ncbi:hotdog fold thioesterase [Haloferax sp. MBLA0076]|uniref:Hotdog fold thioesterase n=1 Tax=Haloferax litoreum TaxID=2666140 RepID=A0A6A8GJQ9_9EURY|nr:MULTISPECIES: PaaI family thioesterase [Haloferax]KAB1189879.1 PaaI family thioesterase [Haloferax sp. CBA1148]MRX23644.1 hotdog fold thioesterase [Haloferax litoreum]
MDIEEFFESMPFARLLGVEITDVEDGHAEGYIEMREDLSWNADRVMAHGGVTFTLADTVGGAALVSRVDQPVPTIDMRIDYLSAGTGDLRAEADVVRLGGDVGTVDVDVYATTDDTLIATARGVYKTG